MRPRLADEKVTGVLHAEQCGMSLLSHHTPSRSVRCSSRRRMYTHDANIRITASDIPSIDNMGRAGSASSTLEGMAVPIWFRRSPSKTPNSPVVSRDKYSRSFNRMASLMFIILFANAHPNRMVAAPRGTPVRFRVFGLPPVP